MAATVASDITNRLEIDYRPRKLISLALKNNFLTSWLPKSEDGNGLQVNLRYWRDIAGGTGSTVTEAEAAETSNQYDVSTHSWKLMYTAWSINIATLNRTKGTTIGDELTNGMRGAMQRHGNEIETFLIGRGGIHAQGGQTILGRRASISSNTVTLTEASDAFNFQKGQIISADDTATGASPRTGTTAVTAVDYSAGTVTLANAAAIDSFADNDYLFLTGFLNGAAPKGLFDIIPVTVSGSDSFGGLNRSVAPEKLAGFRATGTAGENPLEQLLDMLSQGSKTYTQAPNLAVMGVNKLRDIKKVLGNKVEYGEFSSKKFGVRFQGVVIDGPDGQVMLKSHRQYPEGYVHFLTRNTWKLRSVQEPLIAVATKTGKYIDAQSDDAIKLRWRTQCGLFCDFPIDNGVGTFA